MDDHLDLVFTGWCWVGAALILVPLVNETLSSFKSSSNHWFLGYLYYFTQRLEPKLYRPSAFWFLSLENPNKDRRL